MQKTNDKLYVYASTRIRAAEGNGTEKERLDRLLEAKSTSAVASLIIDSGLVPAGVDTGEGVSSLLNRALDHAVHLVLDAVPEPEMYSFLLYKYDCNNLKVCIKAHFKGSGADGLYFTCGTVPPENAEEAVRNRNFTAFPPHMAAAAAEAIDSYEQTGESRSIDFILDRACFADVSDAAAATGVPFFGEYTSAVADTTNLLTSARIADSGADPAAAEALLNRVYLPGGQVKLSTLLSPDGGAAPFSALAERMDPSPLKNITAEITSFEDADRLYGEYLNSLTASFAFKAFGPEIPACFLIEREKEITRFRKAAALISAGVVGKDKLRERMGALL